MNLEWAQGIGNKLNVFSGNTSASNEGQQQRIDGKEVIKRGALKAAAGQELGLSEEETLKAVSRQNRRQKQREAFRTRQQRDREWGQKQKTLADEGFKVQAPDTDFLDPDTAAAFGQDQSDYYEYQEGDTQYNEQRIARIKDAMGDMEVQDDSGQRMWSKYGVTLKNEADRGDYEALAAELQDLQPTFEQFAPREAGVAGALETVRAEIANRGNSSGGLADIETRLEDDLRQDSGAERALAGELARRDQANMDPEVMEANDWRAAAEADLIARTGFTVNGEGAFADEAIGRIEEIRKLGGSGILSPSETAQVIRAQASADLPVAIQGDGVALNPVDGSPLGVIGPESPFSPNVVNTPNSGGMVNVPQGQNATQWLTANVPQYREGGRVFGDFQQTDINLTATNLANKLKEYGMTGVPDQIRTIEEFDHAIQLVGADMAAKGEQAFVFNPETRTNVPSDTFGAEEFFTKMRMTGPERTATANMLYQLTVARGTEINQNAKTAFMTRTAAPADQVIFDAPEAMIDSAGQARIAQIPPGTNVTTGFQESGKPIRQTVASQLAALDAGPDVTIPYMGAVVDPSTGKIETDAGPGYLTRFKGLAGPNRDQRQTLGTGTELEEAILAQARRRAGRKPVNMARVRDTTTKARLVEERQARDDRRRAAQRDRIRRFTPANLRQAGRYA